MKKLLISSAVLCTLAAALAACKETHTTDRQAVASDKPFVAAGYEQQLSRLGLTQVESFPYFTKPFICVAVNDQGKQVAVAFQSADQFKTVELPLSYDEMKQRVQSSGIVIKNIGNLRLSEINSRLLWSFHEAETGLYWDLDGKPVANPFQ